MAMRQNATPGVRPTPVTSGVKRTLPDENLLASGVFVMPGTKDMTGRMLLLLPCRFLALLGRYTVLDLTNLLQYYTYTAIHAGHRSGFAAVADLGICASREVIIKLVETLERMQTGTRDGVHVFYALPPKNKDVHRAFKKMTGLKPSKKHPKIPVFETILLDSQGDLQRYIDASQIGPDLGGSLFYNHGDWVQLVKNTRELGRTVDQALQGVPAAQDKLNMLLEYEVPDTQPDAEATLLQIRHKYNDVMRELNLEHLIDKCKMLQGKYEKPADHLDLSDISLSPTLTQVRAIIQKHVEQLVRVREDLKNRWQHAEERMLIHARINKYKNKAEKVMDWIDNVGLPTVNHEPEIADCLSKAEILKNHFDTGFFSVAQNVLWLGGKISQKLEEVATEQKRQITVSKNLRAFSRQFRNRCEYFRQAVDKKRQVYMNVHNFYGTASKVTKWYKKTLQFLPTQLLSHSPQGGATGGTNSAATYTTNSAATYTSPAWLATVENYLLHNPCPSAEQLSSMQNTTPVIDDVTIRNQARLLTARVTTLRKVLLSPERASVNDLQDILRWKNNLQIGEDELQDMRIPGSSLYIGEAQGRAAVIGTSAAQTLQYTGELGPEPHIIPKSPGVARRSTTLGVRPAAPLTLGKHGPGVNRAISLQYAQNPNQVSVRRDLYGYFSDQDSIYGQTANSDNERYVPLTLNSTTRNQELPHSLRHIDINAFKDNIPQGLQPHSANAQTANQVQNQNRTPDQQPLYYVDQYGNVMDPQYLSHIASQESLADSGFVQTPHISPSEYNPCLADRFNSMSKGHERGLNISLIKPAKSMPDLNEEPNEGGNLILAKPTIERVMNSDRTPEEKLDMMALIIEGDCDQGNGISVANVPVHLKKALKKLQPMGHVNVGDLRQGHLRVKPVVQQVRAVHHPHPQLSEYQTIQQNKQPTSAQSFSHQMSNSSPIPSQFIHRPPEWLPGVDERTQQKSPYPLYPVYAPNIRHPNPNPYLHQEPVRYRAPEEYSRTIPHGHPGQLRPPEVIPIHSASVLSSGVPIHSSNIMSPGVVPIHSPSVLYENPLEPLPPVLIPVSESGVPPGEDAIHSRSTGIKAHRLPHDTTLDSQTSRTVDTEEVLPQEAERHKPSQLRASTLQNGSSRPYGIDIEQWVSEQQEQGVDHHQGSLLEGSDLEEIDTIEDYIPSKKRDRFSEQEKLEKAKHALEEMIVADEEHQQDEVEQSLKRTEKMLQEQEDLMLQNRINEMVKEAQRNQRQESSVSGSTAPSGVDVDEQLLGAVGGPGAAHPGGGRDVMAPPGFPLELLEGASVSGESGVFTQTSAESRARTADLDSFGPSSRQSLSNSASARPSVSSLSTVTDSTRKTSETSSATTTPHGDGPGFFPNKVYKPSAARQHDFRDLRSKSSGDLARSRLRSSERSRGPSATDLAIEPLIEHEYDEDYSEDVHSYLRDPKSPKSADVSSSIWDSSSATNTVLQNSHPALIKSTSASAILGAENRNRRSMQLVDMARSSFAKSCDEILDQYGLKGAPQRRHSSSLASSCAVTDSTTSSSSQPYISMNDSVTHVTNITEPLSSIAPQRPKHHAVTEGRGSSIDTSTSQYETGDSNNDNQGLSASRGTRSKLLQMSSMKMVDSTDTAKTTKDVTNSNGLDLQARDFKGSSNF